LEGPKKPPPPLLKHFLGFFTLGNFTGKKGQN